MVALQSKRAVRVLTVHDQPGLQTDLLRVRRLTQSGLPVYPEEALAPGRDVRVTRGPLRGVAGTIIRCCGRHRLVVAVDFIRQGISVEIDANSVEPC